MAQGVIHTLSPDSEARWRAQALLEEYVAVVDDPARLEEWPRLFAPDGRYYVCTRENFERDLPVALVVDDSRDRLLDRVSVIRELWKGHFDEQSTVHVLSAPRLLDVGEGEVRLSTNFLVTLVRLDAGEFVLSGRYLSRVALTGSGEARFREQRVVLQNSVVPTYFVYPL